jgi:hypothetical protein
MKKKQRLLCVNCRAFLHLVPSNARDCASLLRRRQVAYNLMRPWEGGGEGGWLRRCSPLRKGARPVGKQLPNNLFMALPLAAGLRVKM